jgi:uncharacterized protein (TIGR03435 family)
VLQRLIGLSAAFLALAASGRPARAQSQMAQQSQTEVPAAPAFDVAAIHLHESQPHEHNSIWSSPLDGHFRTENISVMALIHWAWEMPETRILGAPGWANTAHFDIDATADPAVDQQLKGLSSDAAHKQKEKMVQALLADRFKLATRFETRDLPIYELVAAKGGAKLGPAQESGTTINTSNGRIEVQGANSVAILAEELSKVVGRPVFDKTGIAGRYDLKLKWTPDDITEPTLLNGAAVDSGPSIFTALEEQLGLKLEPGKGPVQVLVIDHVEMPSAN